MVITNGFTYIAVLMLIAGGLLETKQEVTEALSAGAAAISTGAEALWYL